MALRVTELSSGGGKMESREGSRVGRKAELIEAGDGGVTVTVMDTDDGVVVSLTGSERGKIKILGHSSQHGKVSCRRVEKAVHPVKDGTAHTVFFPGQEEQLIEENPGLLMYVLEGQEGFGGGYEGDWLVYVSPRDGVEMKVGGKTFVVERTGSPLWADAQISREVRPGWDN